MAPQGPQQIDGLEVDDDLSSGIVTLSWPKIDSDLNDPWYNKASPHFLRTFGSTFLN